MPAKVDALILQGVWTQAAFTALQADSTYVILWSSAEKAQAPAQADVDRVAAVLQVHGAETADVSVAVDDKAHTKEDLAVNLAAWLAAQPKVGRVVTRLAARPKARKPRHARKAGMP